MAETTDSPDNEPIDVEFTSADPAETKHKHAQSSGPGWIGLMSTGVVAALAGGAIGVVAGGTGGRYAQASEVAVDISKLQEADRSIAGQISLLRENLRDAEVRLSAAVETLDKTETEANARLDAVRADLNSVKESYLALLGETPEPTEATPTPVPTPEDGATPVPGEDAPVTLAQTALPKPAISFARLVERMEAMESTGTGKGTAPAELARSVAALQERTAQLETVDAGFTDAMAARGKLLTSLSGEVATIEKTIASLSAEVEANTSTLGAGDIARKETLDNLSAEVEALRGLLNERLSKLDDAKLSKNEQALIHRADRVLSMSTLETAMRRGEPFQQELEALAIQLPANGRVSALRRIAEEGAPTLDQLRLDLAALAEPVARAGKPKEAAGQWAWVGDLLSTVVTVRETETSDGQTASRSIQSAIRRLDASDLAGAIDELKPIEGVQGEMLAEWLGKADRRLRADGLLERLRSDVFNLEDAE